MFCLKNKSAQKVVKNYYFLGKVHLYINYINVFNILHILRKARGKVIFGEKMRDDYILISMLLFVAGIIFFPFIILFWIFAFGFFIGGITEKDPQKEQLEETRKLREELKALKEENKTTEKIEADKPKKKEKSEKLMDENDKRSNQFALIILILILLGAIVFYNSDTETEKTYTPSNSCDRDAEAEKVTTKTMSYCKSNPYGVYESTVCGAPIRIQCSNYYN